MMYMVKFDSTLINRIFYDDWMIENLTKEYYSSPSKADIDVRFVAEYLNNMLKKLKDSPSGTEYIIFNEDERHTLNKYGEMNITSLYDKYCRNKQTGV